MNTLEIAAFRVLVSIFVDAHQSVRRYMTHKDFVLDYGVTVKPRLFNSIIRDLQTSGIVKFTQNGSTLATRLHSHSYDKALSRILTTLNADVFSVDWDTKRVITDASDADQELLIPIPENWMIIALKRGGPQNEDPPPISPQTSQTAGRDINHFHGPISGHGVNNGNADESKNWWAQWGTIFGGTSVIIAIGALIATWYFWRYPHP